MRDQAHILLIAVGRLGKMNVQAVCLSRWKHYDADIQIEPNVFKMIDN